MEDIIVHEADNAPRPRDVSIELVKHSSIQLKMMPAKSFIGSLKSRICKLIEWKHNVTVVLMSPLY